MIKTTDPDFSRDERTNALINTNISAFKQYKIARQNKNAVAKSEQEIADLKEEVKQLKFLVEKLMKDTNV